ncbi:MAG: hypothetical protein LUD51_05795 [Clostridia bacterium]|nr:hypothetical protein [Clostridia bacterium]
MRDLTIKEIYHIEPFTTHLDDNIVEWYNDFIFKTQLELSQWDVMRCLIHVGFPEIVLEQALYLLSQSIIDDGTYYNGCLLETVAELDRDVLMPYRDYIKSLLKFAYATLGDADIWDYEDADEDFIATIHQLEDKLDITWEKIFFKELEYHYEWGGTYKKQIYIPEGCSYQSYFNPFSDYEDRYVTSFRQSDYKHKCNTTYIAFYDCEDVIYGRGGLWNFFVNGDEEELANFELKIREAVYVLPSRFPARASAEKKMEWCRTMKDLAAWFYSKSGDKPILTMPLVDPADYLYIRELIGDSEMVAFNVTDIENHPRRCKRYEKLIRFVSNDTFGLKYILAYTESMDRKPAHDLFSFVENFGIRLAMADNTSRMRKGLEEIRESARKYMEEHMT